MTLDVSYTCDSCQALVDVVLQVPDGTTCRQVAEDLDRYDFQARVEHDAREHLVDLLTAASEMTHLAAVLARPSVLLVCGDNRLYCRDGAE